MKKFKWKVGHIVRATEIITEGGGGRGSKHAKFPHRDYIHAEPGEIGRVEYVHTADNVPTVRFERGTSTIVGDDEIELVPGIFNKSGVEL